MLQDVQYMKPGAFNFTPDLANPSKIDVVGGFANCFKKHMLTHNFAQKVLRGRPDGPDAQSAAAGPIQTQFPLLRAAPK